MNISKRNTLLKSLLEKRAIASFRSRGINPFDIISVEYAQAYGRYNRAINRVLAIAPSAGKVDYDPKHNPTIDRHTLKPGNAEQWAHEQMMARVKAEKSVGRHWRVKVFGDVR